MRSYATRDGDDWILNGEKMWISLADVADHFLFFCWTDLEKQSSATIRESAVLSSSAR